MHVFEIIINVLYCGFNNIVQHLFNGFDVQMRDTYISNKNIIVSKFTYLPKCEFHTNSKKEIRNETIV